MNPAVRQYLKRVASDFSAGDATEHTHRPTLQLLLEALAPKIRVTNEPKRIAAGAPDLLLSRVRGHGRLSVGHVEAKDIGISLDATERTEQLGRYRSALPNLILTDYLEFRWFQNGETHGHARLGRLKKGAIVPAGDNGDAAVQLLTAFAARSPEEIATPEELAGRLARLTHLIKDMVLTVFMDKQQSTVLGDLLKAFRDVLLPDMTEAEFSDMFAQTLSYGLFAARVHHPEGKPFTRLDAAHEIPRTNPFLRKLFAAVTGPDLDDEPFSVFVDDIVQLLSDADMEKILKSFGRSSGKQDPVFHFYETFLAEYDPSLRQARGVYFTPEPVVSFMVRSVNELLQDRFGIVKGFSDSSLVQADLEEEEESQVPDLSTHKVLVLDPACGTGTFLHHVVALIRDGFRERKAYGAWSSYVNEHLLPRLFGFEVLMAPYAVAHLKLGLQLGARDLPRSQREEWAYNFSRDDRLHVYLTNTLEEVEVAVQEKFGFLRTLAEEANAASRVKSALPIMVILGNPPYAAASANQGQWIESLVRQYYSIDGETLGERNPRWLQDDYVKFIRFAQWRIEKTGSGVLAFITNHGFMDNPTFRGMRYHLMQAFSDIFVLDLHGNKKKREKCPDGSQDDNVFDIQQGVSISFMLRIPGKKKKRLGRVWHAELWGSRDFKYDALNESSWKSIDWTECDRDPPLHLFIPRDKKRGGEYDKGWSLQDIFPLSSAGIVTARDALTVAYTRDEVLNVVKRFCGMKVAEAREAYDLGPDSRDWTVELAQKDLRDHGVSPRRITPILYRPFDVRHTYYTGRSRGFLCMPRSETMTPLLSGKNIALVSARSNKSTTPDHFFCSRWIVEAKAAESTTQSCVFPLYRQEEKGLFAPKALGGAHGQLTPNVSVNFVNELKAILGVEFTQGGSSDLTQSIGPEDVLAYVYAIVHAPGYRERYREFLRLDFARIPISKDAKKWRALCRLGHSLLTVHLDGVVPTGAMKYPKRGDDRVKYVRFKAATCRVHINEDQFFGGVSEEAWGFSIGGYRVAEKWLKGRVGRTLTFDDIESFLRTVAAIERTRELMEEIDRVCGEWPLK